jgi:lipopolysaccharide cholinephosphotransferase
MKEMTLQEIQDLQLEMMQKVHEFCVSHNIRYSLGGGTLLGAIRHKGYIPWDDDIDIMMPRPDYERFIREFNGVDPDFTVQNYYTDISFHREWTRINNDRTLLVYDLAVGGVYVEIFPIDGLPDEEKTREYLSYIKSLRIKLWRTVKKKREAIQGNFYLSRLKYYMRQLVFPNRKKVIGEYEKLFNSYPFDTAKYAGAIIGVYGMKEHMNADVFKKYILVPFEKYHFYAIADYDAYLKKHYGDYMQLPPKEQQKSEHNFKVYWK